MEKFIFGLRETDVTQYTLYITHNTENMSKDARRCPVEEVCPS